MPFRQIAIPSAMECCVMGFCHGHIDCRMVPWNGSIMGFYLLSFEATAMFLCLPREPISAQRIAVGRPIWLRGLAVLLIGLFVFGFIGRAVGQFCCLNL